MGKSNLLRNCISQSYMIKNQVVNQDEKETLVKECLKGFSEKHPEYQVFHNKNYTYGNNRGEIDVLVVYETDIILIECKCPLSPTSNFEMRASVDHIEKADKQLTLCKKVFEDKNFTKDYLKSIKVTDQPRIIRTCIVMGNRLFNGYSVNNHPIRYIRELDMVLNIGKIYSTTGAWRIWQKDIYSHSDLLSFISANNELGLSNFAAMEGIEEFMHIKGKKISYKTYLFNVAKAVISYDEKFHIEKSNEVVKKELVEFYQKHLRNKT